MSFLELIALSEINESIKRSDTIDSRVTQLEAEVRQLRAALNEALRRLEQRFSEDMNKDGKIG